MAEDLLSSQLLEEYKICHAKATEMEKNIWQTSAIFSGGSILGIVTIFKKGTIVSDWTEPFLLFFITCVAISILFLWSRLANRLYSIQQVMIRRMEHIERKTYMRANLYVAYLNDEKINRKTKENSHTEEIKDNARVEFSNFDIVPGTIHNPYLPPELLDDLKKIGRYEHKGVLPMIDLVFWINLIAWLSMMGIRLFGSCFDLKSKSTSIILISSILIVGIFIHHWQKQ
jgi:hypothetical protein